MNVLFLGRDDSPLIPWLREQGEEVHVTSDAIDAACVAGDRFDVLVSYRYRHILKGDVLRAFPDRAFNLHISYLPWNRGADPHLWSFLERSPKGVTIHHMDEGLDTGDLVAQREVAFDLRTGTLDTAYARLHDVIQVLFRDVWAQLRDGSAPRIPQVGNGSYHRLRDKEPWLHRLPLGGATPLHQADGLVVDAE